MKYQRIFSTKKTVDTIISWFTTNWDAVNCALHHLVSLKHRNSTEEAASDWKKTLRGKICKRKHRERGKSPMTLFRNRNLVQEPQVRLLANRKLFTTQKRINQRKKNIVIFAVGSFRREYFAGIKNEWKNVSFSERNKKQTD